MSQGGLIQTGDLSTGDAVEDVADVVVIGTGAGGATVARVLSEQGLDVVMVEEGPGYRGAARRMDAWSAFKHAWRDASFQVAQGRAFAPILQGCAVGGTTPINGAIIHRMPEEIHAGWCRDYGLAEGLSYDELIRVWDTLDEELSVSPTPEGVWGGNNRLFRQGFDAMNYASSPTHRAVKDCEASSRCNQGCRNERKQSMDVTFIPRAIERGARVYATCRAEEVLVENGRAVGCRGRFKGLGSKASGPTLTVHARKAVVLAAGAVHTPLLLLKQGLGNSSGLLGRRLQCHPGTALMALFDEPVGLFHGAAQGYESTHFWSERMKFEVVGLPPAVAVARLPGYGGILGQWVDKLEHLAHWGLQIRARTHGRVRKGFGGKPSITYDLTNEDVATMKLAMTRLAKAAFAAGARAVLPGVHGVPATLHSPDELSCFDDLGDDPRNFHFICAHLFGTATMGADRRQSVVDPHGELWDLPGLYVADASVLPTNFGVNPQHTISAVAWLIAEGLADRFS